MTATLTLTRKSTPGATARRLRISSHLSQRELADLAGIPYEQVSLFEHNLPLPLDSRRRILKELWARKIKK
ncbi:MAG: helix-turn-helix transcriptional regulator [Dehalococcoidales bacterium]|nr:helix-turn-helix transcriptional regulator [Dehalococcoidales bacterium]